MKRNLSDSRSISKMVVAIIAFTSLLSISISCLILSEVIERHDEELIKVIVSNVHEDINKELIKPIMVAQTMANDQFLRENLKAETSIPFDEEVEILSVYLDSIAKSFNYSCVAVTSNATMNYYTQKGFYKKVSPLYDEYDTWYKKFVEKDVEYNFDVNLDETNNDVMTVFVDTKIRDENGNLLGVCAVGMLMERLQDIFIKAESAHHIKINLVDRHGLIKVDSQSYKIENALIDSVIDTQTNNQIVLKKVEDIYIITKYIPEFDWYLVIQRDSNREIGTFSNLIFYMLVGFFFAMVIVLTAVQWSVSRKQRQIEDLAKKHGIASHSGLYASMHLIDLSDDSIHELSRDPNMNLLNLGDGNNAAMRFHAAVNQMTDKDELQNMLQFIDLNTLEERMANSLAIHHEFLSRQHGWCKAHFMVVDQNHSGNIHQFVFAIEVIDAAKQREKQLISLSETDAMTGLLNRGSGEKKIRTLISGGIEGMFCMLDADKFKSVNDNYGHDVGDKVIIAIADCLKKAFRNTDVIMRLGGDEFSAYLLGVTDEERGRIAIERFFKEIEKIDIPELGERKITISLGASVFDGTADCSFEEIYKRADEATYVSKKTVGNCMTFN